MSRITDKWNSLTNWQQSLIVIIMCLAMLLLALIVVTIILLIYTDIRLKSCKIKKPPANRRRIGYGVRGNYDDIKHDKSTTRETEFSTIKEFIVSLHFKHSNGKRITFCVGSIIASKWLITSSVCMHSKLINKTYARAGSIYHDRGGTLHKIIDFVVPDWRKNDTDFSTLRYISLAMVQEPFGIDCGGQLPKQSIDEFIPNYRLYTAGWGTHLSITIEPQYQELKLISSQMYGPSVVCRDYLKEREELTALLRIENVLCAGDLEAPSKDRCNIDAGAPLVRKGIISGISWSGMSCKNYPTVYAKVSLYINWTSKFIKNLGSAYKINVNKTECNKVPLS